MDRIHVGVCGAIWLTLIAASVFAISALSRLASGHPRGEQQQSSWLLYSIIAVSALVILAAIPLLLRARRTAAADSGEGEAAPESPLRTEQAPGQVRVFGVDPYARKAPQDQPPVWPAKEIVDRLWLRGTLWLLSAIGLALTAAAVGAYLLADVGEEAAWAAFGMAGVLTAAMPAVLVFFQRRVGEAIEESAEVAA